MSYLLKDFLHFCCVNLKARWRHANFYRSWNISLGRHIACLQKKGIVLKNSYWSASILRNLSKVFKRCLHKRITSIFKDSFSKYQCRFSKYQGHDAQHCALASFEKKCNRMDMRNIFGVLCTNLSNAFDCVP